ncbi:MAG: hypothetical protein CMG66_00040 [Candidatus Marinimicrobia bacterium]|nr:hypothetical protein [Candidatus Neomarinimicrobiota bacterium]
MNKNEEIISASAMLLSIAKADDNLDNKEIESIKDIIKDFFQLSNDSKIDKLVDIAQNKLNESTDIFEFGRALNNNWSYEDKVDFICCTFEVGYSDGDLHYFEEHIIKKIATILNVNHQDLIQSKSDMKKIFS